MRQTIDHFTSSDFWPLYNHLPTRIRLTANKDFSLLKSNPKHPSLHLKKIGDIWSVRVGVHYRAVGMDAPSEESGILWIWIGSHGIFSIFRGKCHCEERSDEAISLYCSQNRDCFAALAMTLPLFIEKIRSHAKYDRLIQRE